MKITVRYWIGASWFRGTATTYKGAMRIAARNQNAWPVRFYDQAGRELYDTGYGLAYPEADAGAPGVIVCAV